MGTEFLVASLWGVVLVYWFWSRRPSTADTVGLFRRELRVLEDATPARVAPANRRCVGDVPALPTLLAAASGRKRMEVRRRRRDVLLVLAAVVIVTLALAAIARSSIAFASQAVSDLAFLCYTYLLVRAARAGVARVPRRAVGDLGAPVPARVDRPAKPLAPAAAMPATALATSSSRVISPRTRSYEPAHALSRAVRWAAVGDGDETYGDFDSYASLALASAR